MTIKTEKGKGGEEENIYTNIWRQRVRDYLEMQHNGIKRTH